MVLIGVKAQSAETVLCLCGFLFSFNFVFCIIILLLTLCTSEIVKAKFAKLTR